MNKRRVAFIIVCGLFLLMLYVFLRRSENEARPDAWPAAITWNEPYVGYVDVNCVVDGYSERGMKLFLRAGDAYFCLPSFARGRKLFLDFDPKSFEVAVDGKPLLPGDEIPSASSGLSVTYISSAYGRIDRDYNLSMVFSENLPAVFVDTKTGSLDHVDEDKLNTDAGYFNCVDAGGNILNTARIGLMRAKGQSSFTLAKKNYKINLLKETALMGMDTGSSWVLQANAMDTSHLRNATAYKLASVLGMEGVVDYRFADVYFNGEYHGNYMVIQTVDHYFEKHMATDRDSFLLEKETWEERLKSDSVYMEREGGVYWEFLFPELPGKAFTDRASLRMDRLEEALKRVRDTGDLSAFSQCADVRSFAQKYILDVLTNEPDSNSHSTFCTYDSLRGKFIMGPVWDYDRAWGNRPDINRYPCFEAFDHSWPEMLAQNREYLELCREIMEDTKEETELLYTEEADGTAAYIAASQKMDRIVNGGGISTVVDFEDQRENTEFLKESFKEIHSGFYEYIQEPDAFAHVYFESGSGRAYRIRKGERIPSQILEYLKKLYGCDGFVSDDGPFDENTVVYTDMTVSGG